MLLLLPTLSALAPAEIILTAHMDVAPVGPSAPAPGDYKFTFTPTQAVVSAPNRKTFVFQFDQNMFTSIDPLQRTYYQESIDDVISLGSGSAQGKVNGSVTLAETTGSNPTLRMVRAATCYQVSLESALGDKAGSPLGLGDGYTPDGRFVFSGAKAAQNNAMTGHRVLRGQLWLGNRALEIDADHMNTALECVLLWGAPELKELDKRIHKTKRVIYGGQFAISVNGRRQIVGTPPEPVITFSVRTIETGPFDASSLLVPPSYKRVAPPTIRFQ